MGAYKTHIIKKYPKIYVIARNNGYFEARIYTSAKDYRYGAQRLTRVDAYNAATDKARRLKIRLARK
jgi:hypothetical protein